MHGNSTEPQSIRPNHTPNFRSINQAWLCICLFFFFFGIWLPVPFDFTVNNSNDIYYENSSGTLFLQPRIKSPGITEGSNACKQCVWQQNCKKFCGGPTCVVYSLHHRLKICIWSPWSQCLILLCKWLNITVNINFPSAHWPTTGATPYRIN